jgi:hypothetical protein
MELCGIFIGTEALQAMSAQTRAAVLQAVGLDSSQTVGSPLEEHAAADHEGLARFGDRQVRQLLKKPLHPTTRLLLEVVASGPRSFRVGDVLKKMKVQSVKELRGVLSGLTRRTRKIANDPELNLFNTVTEVPDEKECIVEVHQETHDALRRAFKKS